MRAVAVFPKSHEVRVIERPPPPLTGAQVLLRILEVGICGTDREIASGHYGTPPAGEEYLVLGHEALARVEDVGPAVRQLRKGDLVIPTVRRPCPHANCPACRAGRQDFCITGDFRERGIKEAHGYLVELTVEDEQNLVRVPRQLAEVAVLTEPLTVAAKGAEQAQAIEERLPWEAGRKRAVVLGAGPVGLLGAMDMVVNDFETHVFSLEPSNSDRAELVRSFGASYVSGQDVPLEKLGERLGLIDLIYEAVGVSSVAFTALSSLGPNGVFVMTGVPGVGGPRPVEIDRLMRRIVLNNQVVLGTVNASLSAFRLAIRGLEQAMALFPDGLRRLITGRSSLEQAPQLIQKRGGIKEVVRVSAPAM